MWFIESLKQGHGNSTNRGTCLPFPEVEVARMDWDNQGKWAFDKLIQSFTTKGKNFGWYPDDHQGIGFSKCSFSWGSKCGPFDEFPGF